MTAPTTGNKTQAIEPAIGKEVLPLDNVRVLDVKPSYPEEVDHMFELFVDDETRAVILNTYNTGGLLESFIPHIREVTERGVPVFVVSGNYGTDHGILKVSYGSLQEGVKAGAIPLRDVNVNHLGDVAQAIQRAINGGLEGGELQATVIDQFGVADGVVPEAATA